MKKQKIRDRADSIPKSLAMESFGMIKVNLEFLSVDNVYKCILVSSPTAGEGKSTLTANLAMSLAASDKKTLIVDGDLRKPTQHKLFDISNKIGLSNILINNYDWHEYVNKVNTTNLYVITAGRIPPNPVELLGCRRMGELVADLKNAFDIILFDSSPILVVPDAISLAKHIDGVLLVARHNMTTIQMARSTKEALKLVGKPILGAVLNNVPITAGRYEYLYEEAKPKKRGTSEHQKLQLIDEQQIVK